MSRHCQIYVCSTRNKDVCCADCDRQACTNRCLNAPERCGQVFSGKKPRVIERSTAKEEQKNVRMTVCPGECKDKFALP